MGAISRAARRLAGFFGLGLGLVVLFGVVALAALRPVDSLAWVRLPTLAPDLRLDAGLESKPLNGQIVADALRDQALTGPAGASMLPVIPPILALSPPSSPAAPSAAPSARPTVSPPPTARPAPTPTAAPTPTGQPAPTPTPSPTPGPTPSPVPTPTPVPTPSLVPTPTPIPSAAFAVVSASETVTHTPNNRTACTASTVMASGTFTTNGSGGTVSYEWVRTDRNGNRTLVAEPSITIAPGDTAVHTVAVDSWTPAEPGTEQLVFLSPSAPVVPAQSWNCHG